MLGGFLGARLFHVIYEQPDFYLQNPQVIFMFWMGGFVYFGGAVGAFLTCITLLRWRRENFWPWADLSAPIMAFGYASGRVGCFLAGCCFGRECDLPWAVTFPAGVDAPAHVPLHPTQMYATFWELGVLALILFSERSIKRSFKPGALFCLWMLLHGIGRLMMEYFRADFRGSELAGLSISSWFSLIFILLGTIGLYKKRI